MAQIHAQDIPSDLNEQLRGLKEGFTPMLLRKIRERGITEVECYKRAHINRRQFSRIQRDTQYHPRKTTAIAFALALELDVMEAQALLRTAGYTLSDSLAFDVVVMYFIQQQNYDLFELNDVLTKCGLPTLNLD